jgi:hypothetical protein
MNSWDVDLIVKVLFRCGDWKGGVGVLVSFGPCAFQEHTSEMLAQCLVEIGEAPLQK